MPSISSSFLVLVGGAAAIVIVGMWLGWSWQVNELEARITVLTDRIEHTDTGYVAQLAQCRTNNAGLVPRLDRLGLEIKQLGIDTKTRDDRLAANMKGPAADARAARVAADQLLNRPREAPIGTLDACIAGERAFRGTLQ